MEPVAGYLLRLVITLAVVVVVFVGVAELVGLVRGRLPRGSHGHSRHTPEPHAA